MRSAPKVRFDYRLARGMTSVPGVTGFKFLVIPACGIETPELQINIVKLRRYIEREISHFDQLTFPTQHEVKYSIRTR